MNRQSNICKRRLASKPYNMGNVEKENNETEITKLINYVEAQGIWTRGNSLIDIIFLGLQFGSPVSGM